MSPKGSCVQGLVPDAAVFRDDWILRALTLSVDQSIGGFIAEWTVGR
jgi:hypothetical protein